MEDTEISKAYIDDVLKRLDAFSAATTTETESPIDKGNKVVYGSSATSIKKSYDNISAHLNALAKNQKELDSAKKSTPVLKFFSTLKARLSGIAADSAETIDDLTEKQFEIVGALHDSIKDAKRDAHNALSELINYKDNVTFKNFTEAIDAKRFNEKDLDYLTGLYGEATKVLSAVKKGQPEYVKAMIRQREVRRGIQQRLANIAKSNQEIVFGDAELKSLAESEDVENMLVLMLDQVQQYTRSSLDFAKNKKKLHDQSAGGEYIIKASQDICGSLSKTLASESSQLDVSMRKIKAIASKAHYKMLMPDSLMAGKAGYAADILGVTKGINLQLESQARKVMDSYGQPT
jgi:hypothetical protein